MSKDYQNSLSDEDKKIRSLHLSNMLKGKKKPKRTDEHRKNMSISLKGKSTWNKGKKNIYTKESIEKIRNNNFFNKSILVYDLEDNFLYEFISISEASRKLKIGRCTISNLLTGRITRSKINKYIFKYKLI